MNTSTRHFKYAVDGDVAVVTFEQEGESVNTLSPEVANELETVLTRAASDGNVRALVIASGKKDSFIVGAKIDYLQTLKTESDAQQASRSQQGTKAGVSGYVVLITYLYKNPFALGWC